MKFKKQVIALSLSAMMMVGSTIPALAAENIDMSHDYIDAESVKIYTINGVESKSTMTYGEDIKWNSVAEDGTTYEDFISIAGTTVPVYQVSVGDAITLHGPNQMKIHSLYEKDGKLYVENSDLEKTNPNAFKNVTTKEVPYLDDEELKTTAYYGNINFEKEGYYFFSAYKLDPVYRLEAMAVVLHVKQPAQPEATQFTDVKETDYFYNAVNWAVENKITSGTTKDTFSPYNTCTNAQIITFLWRASGSEEPVNGTAFTDVPSDAYYAKAAAWAYEKGLVSGDQFNPDSPCNRLSTVQFMWKLANKPVLADYKIPFTDVEKDDQQAVAWALQKGITSGTSETTFSPEKTCTRGQIVTFLFNGYAK